MTRLSIVIPMLGNAEVLETGLVSVLENRPAACEVLVVLNGEYANPYQLEDEVRFVQASPRADWSASVNQGIAEARGEIVHLLQPGVEVSPGWEEAPLRHFDNPAVGAVAPLVIDRQRPRRILTMGVGFRRGGRPVVWGRNKKTDSKMRVPAAKILGPTTMAGFYRKSMLEMLGKFEPSVGDAYAAIDLALRMRRIGLESVTELSSLVYAQAPARGNRGFRDGLFVERLYLRQAQQGGLADSLALHFFTVCRGVLERLLDPMTATCHLAGRLAAWCELPRHLRHRRNLDQLAEQAAAAIITERQIENARIDRPHDLRPSRTPKTASISQEN